MNYFCIVLNLMGLTVGNFISINLRKLIDETRNHWYLP